jgi:Protein of unknown function (DUF3738)
MLKTIRAIACAALLTSLLAAQTPSTPPTPAPPAATATAPSFDIADVHPSPHSTDNFMRGGQLRGDRYILRGATMVDLVANAYNVDPLNVLAGPAWLELDRFDIFAKAPRTTSPDDVRLMLRALLAQRFHLVAHTDGSAAAPAVSDPSGAISLPDAIYKTLGLKLEKVKRPVPMLVIDHIEEKPTDN